MSGHTLGPCGRDSCFQLFPGHTKACWDARAADLRIVRCPKHTPGPLEVAGRDQTGHFIAQVKRHGAVVAQSVVHDGDARLLAAAVNSYDRHCGPRAVECAEADLLGKLIRVLDRYKHQDEVCKTADNGLYRDACEVLAEVDQ